jgi:hypothetical protein
LPKTFRQFDYQTISDVILSISYTAKYDTNLRKEVELENSVLERSIHQRLITNPAGRVFSIRSDFPAIFQRLLHEPIGTAVEIEVTEKYFQAYLTGFSLELTGAVLALRLRQDQPLKGFSLTLDGTPFAAFTAQEKLGGLAGVAVGSALGGKVLGTYEVRVTSAGDLGPPPGSESALDEEKLLDVLLFVEFTVGGQGPLAVKRPSAPSATSGLLRRRRRK